MRGSLRLMAGSERPPGDSVGRVRAAPRRLTCIPTDVETEHDPTQIAVIIDASVIGARLATAVKLTPGETVKLALYLADDERGPRPASGKVVRVEPRAKEIADLWMYDVGVEFDEPIDQYAEEIRKLSERQEDLRKKQS